MVEPPKTPKIELGENATDRSGAKPIENEKDTGCVKTTIQRHPVTFLKYQNETSFTFSSRGPEELSEFFPSYGSQDPDFVLGLILQIANVSPRIRQLDVTGDERESPDVKAIKFALAAVRDMVPQDALEALICTQMAATHSLSMMFTESLDKAFYYQDGERAEQSITRLSRTQSALTATWDHHRSSSLRAERIGRGAKVGESSSAGSDPDLTSGLFGRLTNIGTGSGFPAGQGLKFVRSVWPAPGSVDSILS